MTDSRAAAAQITAGFPAVIWFLSLRIRTRLPSSDLLRVAINSMMVMKRSLLLTASIAACFALMGVAYAAWAQNVSVIGNAMMGNFEIIWQDVSLDRRGEMRYGSSYVPEVTYSVTDGGHRISYTVTNAYPGWESRIRGKVKNNGTVPARLAK